MEPWWCLGCLLLCSTQPVLGSFVAFTHLGFFDDQPLLIGFLFTLFATLMMRGVNFSMRFTVVDERADNNNNLQAENENEIENNPAFEPRQLARELAREFTGPIIEHLRQIGNSENDLDSEVKNELLADIDQQLDQIRQLLALEQRNMNPDQQLFFSATMEPHLRQRQALLQVQRNAIENTPSRIAPRGIWANVMSFLRKIFKSAKDSIVFLGKGVVAEVIISHLVVKIAQLQAKLASALQSNRLFRGDKESLRRLNIQQLSAFKSDVGKVSEAIDETLNSRIDVRPQQTSEPEAQCVFCLSSPATLTLRPCMHRCLCSECFDLMNSNASVTDKCPICALPILSRDYSGRFSQRHITDLQFSYETQQTTKKALQEAGLWKQHKRAINSIPRDKFYE
eukprot:TRINITY_DN6616_c0_g1_i1.p1 TRINITY_DN6616_c0_g1~~TRINITY_DN6616_c0_g1_i1.p1  ORF type:complete len:396 (+),score=79.69 TRINITY_DN6616_c0_g1_i1:557-1744(+)